MTDIPKAVSKHMARMGSKGGKATGAAKSRGDSEHYKEMSRKAVEARERKRKEKGTE